ncbi:aldehyde dehydrogenase family protein [Prescottella sp. R16]|uniref:aldehyde dehydrogenase family protein n=1 Tax=Prescottella sp. R16 TaxID=3064529 RepID=UPI00272E81DD|nr:aldehyde dehydrogenase family protein [Prescottella sp. R16]
MDELVSINPATLDEIGRTPVTSLHELDTAVRRANDVFPGWSADRALRQKLLQACADALTLRAADIVPLLVREQGKTAAEAGGEIWISAEHLTHAAEADWPDEEPGPDAAGRTARVQKIPLGAVAAVVPWNFPVFLTVAKIAPALAAGNTVVVKPAESVSLVVDTVVQLLAEILPEGVLQIVHGGPDVGRTLVEHPLIRKVSFTGSTQVGRLIMKQAAESITPVTLELGGNDPAIVLDDADIAYTAQSLARSAFFNAGQMCVAPKRAYVPAGRVDEFCQAFAAHAAALSVGDGLDPATTMGPLHSKAQLEFVHGLLDDAVARGATIVTGGGRGTDLPGYFLEPTLVRDVDDTFDLVALEQFGPVFPVVAYTSLDDVVATVDSQEFGLGASVWGTDEAAATEVAERLAAGSVWVNQHNAVEVELPFGGIKSSGFGREGGIEGIGDYLQTRVLNIKHTS